MNKVKEELIRTGCGVCSSCGHNSFIRFILENEDLCYKCLKK